MEEKKISSSAVIIVILSVLLILTTGYIVYENLNLKTQEDNNSQLENSGKDHETNASEDETENLDDQNLSAKAKRLKEVLKKINNESSIQKVVFTTINNVNGSPTREEKEIVKNLKTLVDEITNKILDNSGVEALPQGIGFVNADSISIHYTDSDNQVKELSIIKSSDNNIAIFDYRNKYNGELDNTFYAKLNTLLFDYVEQKYFN